MSKYTLRRKDKGVITYIYRTGYTASVKPDYPKFLQDLVKYARVNAEDIETEEDLIGLFDKAKRRGFDFGKTSDSKAAVKREWFKLGNVFKGKKEKRQEYLERLLREELDSERRTKITRRIISVRERGHIVKYEEQRVLIKWVFKE